MLKVLRVSSHRHCVRLVAFVDEVCCDQLCKVVADGEAASKGILRVTVRLYKDVRLGDATVKKGACCHVVKHFALMPSVLAFSL